MWLSVGGELLLLVGAVDFKTSEIPAVESTAYFPIGIVGFTRNGIAIILESWYREGDMIVLET